MKVKSESEVAQSCPTLCDPMDCSLLGPSVHGIFQARVLEWVAIAFSGVLHRCLLLLKKKKNGKLYFFKIDVPLILFTLFSFSFFCICMLGKGINTSLRNIISSFLGLELRV